MKGKNMKQKFGIKKTKMNIFLLFLAGLLIGVIIALRQPMPKQQRIQIVPAQVQTEATTTTEASTTQGK